MCMSSIQLILYSSVTKGIMTAEEEPTSEAVQAAHDVMGIFLIIRQELSDAFFRETAKSDEAFSTAEKKDPVELEQVVDVNSIAIQLTSFAASHLNVLKAPKGKTGYTGPFYRKDYTDALVFLKDVAERQPERLVNIWTILRHMGVDFNQTPPDDVTILKANVITVLRKAREQGVVEIKPGAAPTTKGKPEDGIRWLTKSDKGDQSDSG
jgi:hypothetical protein